MIPPIKQQKSVQIMDIAILLLCGGKMKDDVAETVDWDT
jgi:hypothetical protein